MGQVFCSSSVNKILFFVFLITELYRKFSSVNYVNFSRKESDVTGRPCVILKAEAAEIITEDGSYKNRTQFSVNDKRSSRLLGIYFLTLHCAQNNEGPEFIHKMINKGKDSLERQLFCTNAVQKVNKNMEVKVYM